MCNFVPVAYVYIVVVLYTCIVLLILLIDLLMVAQRPMANISYLFSTICVNFCGQFYLLMKLGKQERTSEFL